MKLRVVGVIILFFIIFITLFYLYDKFFTTLSDIDENLDVKRAEVVQEIKKFKLKKLVRNNKDIVLRKEDFAQISERQKYVTPTNQAVQDYVFSNQITTIKDAYPLAVSWIWVSDETLHGLLEKWLMPTEFIQNTPSYATNPVPGSMVSDCESQAYTLVSVLEAVGLSKQKVRVVIGEVNFSGEVGGHAWVEIYENGEWYELEPTSGPFWDEDDNKLVNNTGFPWNYFKNHPYPVEEYWAFFNDRFYYNPNSGQESPDLPAHWIIQPFLVVAQ